MSELRIGRFDPAADTGQLRAAHQIVLAADREDQPVLPPRSFAMFELWWARGFGGDPRQTWLATAADGAAVGAAVGCYLLVLPERENTSIGLSYLYVTPQARRRGYGSALLAHAAAQAHKAGRSRLNVEARDDSAGAAFAAAVGARPGIAEVSRRLTVDDELAARLPRLQAAAAERSAGYSLVSWTGLTPNQYLPDSMRLSVAMADAPRDEGVEAEFWDAERIRHFEQTGLDAGHQFYAVAARHDQTGRIVALTQLRTAADTPGWSFQALTAVLPEHRGHRLGLLVKTAMLERLRAAEPDVRFIITENAGPNDHMIAINEQLGFEVVAVHRHWDVDTDTR